MTDAITDAKRLRLAIPVKRGTTPRNGHEDGRYAYRLRVDCAFRNNHWRVDGVNRWVRCDHRAAHDLSGPAGEFYHHDVGTPGVPAYRRGHCTRGGQARGHSGT